MFENEKRRNDVIASNGLAISAEEENVVRKNVSPKFFDTEKFIAILNSSDYLDIDIFNRTILPGNDIRWTYLNYLKETRRDIFIKRIPIYFYDLYCEPNEISMTELFNGYKEYETGSPMSGFELESIDDDKLEQEDFDSFDFDPLYQIIDEVIDVFKIPIHLVLQYLKKQCGDDALYWVFKTWFDYIKCVSDLNEGNVFPRNILYSYNVELTKKGLPPVIYNPFITNSGHFLTHKKDDCFLIGGLFPVDEQGNVVNEWTGVWVENSKFFDNAKENNFNTYNTKSNKPALRVSLSIKTGPDTIIYAARFEDDGVDAFGDVQTTVVWEPVYIGPKNMKFDYSFIVKERERKGFTLKALSEATDINIRTLQRIEAGQSTPDSLNLIKIMDCLNIDTYEPFIKRDKLYDQNYEKFKSGKKPSSFLSDTIES